MSARAEFVAQLAIVVDFAVEGENEAAVGREHRLVAGGRRIDDGEAAMAQACRVSRIVDYIRNPDALIVATAMLDAREHRTNQRLRLKAYESSDTTHLDRRESRMRKVVLVVAASSSKVMGAGSPLDILAQIRFICVCCPLSCVFPVRKSSITKIFPPPKISTRSFGSDLSPSLRYAIVPFDPSAKRNVMKTESASTTCGDFALTDSANTETGGAPVKNCIRSMK